MKTVTKLTAAAVLALAAAAPAFAQDNHAMRDTHTMAQTQQASDAYASAPATQPVNDPAAGAVDR